MPVEDFAAKFRLIEAAARRAGRPLSGKRLGCDIFLARGQDDANAVDVAESKWTYCKKGQRPFHSEPLPALWRAVDRQAPGLMKNIAPDEFQHPLERLRRRFTAAGLLARDDLASRPSLPEQLKGLTTPGAVAELLKGLDHTIGWSREFKEAFDLVPDDQDRLIHLFCQAVEECTGVRGRAHVLKLASGTLTYVWNAFEGRPELQKFANQLEAKIDALTPDIVLMAEPLSYIAALNGQPGSFARNIDRMIADPHWRRVDFNERLHYCAVVPGRPLPTALARRVAVGRNIAAHLQRREYLSEILCQDVGRAIEVCPVLARYKRYRELAALIGEGTLARLANAGISRTLRAQAWDLMQGRASA